MTMTLQFADIYPPTRKQVTRSLKAISFIHYSMEQKLFWKNYCKIMMTPSDWNSGKVFYQCGHTVWFSRQKFMVAMDKSRFIVWPVVKFYSWFYAWLKWWFSTFLVYNNTATSSRCEIIFFVVQKCYERKNSD